MTSNLPNVGPVLGVVMLILGTWSIRFSWRRVPVRPRRALILLAVACAIALLMLGEYQPSATERYIGFPFLSFIFIKRGKFWLDYLGPLTLPALVANAYIGFTVPFVATAAWLLTRRRAV